MTEPTTDPASRSGPGTNRFYFAAWRWHFYAGLYVVPFLMMLAVTGLIMLWFTAIAPEYGDRIPVTPQATALSVTEQAAAAIAAHPGGTVVQYIAPYDAATPALVKLDLADGARMLAVDPYTGSILRDRLHAGTWNEFATAIHGELLIGGNGGIGDLLIEIAASLALLLVATGLYLAWPRKGRPVREMLIPSFKMKGRPVWKSLHTVVGTWTALILVVFLISGLSWAGIWGGKFVQAWSTFPAEKWDAVPLSDATHASMNHDARETVPWALEQTSMPASGSAVGVTGVPDGTTVELASIVALGRSIGFDGRFQVAVASGETGVWTLSRDSMSYDSPDPTADRTVHVDRYTGKILADVKYEDYSVPGKAMAVSIAFHEGMMGTWNLVLNVAFCLAVIFITVSGVVMWWKRRPPGLRLGAPPSPAEVPFPKGALPIVVGLSMLFPVLGLTLLAVALLDWLVLSRIPALRNTLN